MYRKIKIRALAAACLLALAAGCSLFDVVVPNEPIRFSAGTSIETKVYYGGEADGYKQLIWENGDVIRILSDRARTPANSNHYDYSLNHTGEQGARSYAKFDIQEGSTPGLRWEDSGTYNFWASYPPVSISDDGRFEASVPSDSYLMVAHTSTGYTTNKRVFLSFYPAFTALEITIDSDDASMPVTGCWLYSEATDLVGSFSAKIGDRGIQSGTYQAIETRGIASPSLVADHGSAGKTFTFFCLPQNLYQIRLFCEYSNGGTTMTKSLELVNSNGSLMSFAACKYHRLHLQLSTSGGDVNVDFSTLTMGGAQMLLSLLKENAYALQTYAASHNVSLDQNLAVNLFNYYVNNNVGQVDARDAFSGSGSNSFSSVQLPIVKDFLETLTSYTHQNTLWATIEATDFQFVPNLRVLTQLEVDPQRVNDYSLSIDVSGLQYLETISLYKCSHLVVRNCPELTSVTLVNMDSNHENELLLENCPKVTSFSMDWNGQRGAYSFRNMQSLQTLTLHNAESIAVDNCPSLTTISLDQATNLTSLSLSNTPNFTSGTMTTVERVVNVSLNACSGNVPGATIYMKGNGNATNGGKTDSNNVTVSFYSNSNELKTSF